MQPNKTLKLFISYRSTDSAKVDPLVHRLRSLGFQVWQDKDSIPVGQDWWEAICEGIVGCDVFIFMLSEESVKSFACLAELSYAHELNLPIIPFVIEGQWTYNAPGKHDIKFWSDIPQELRESRAQFLFYEGVSFVDKLKQGMDILLAKKMPRLPAAPPPDPRHATDATNNVTVIYDEAYDFAYRGELEHAKKLFRKLIRQNDPIFGAISLEWVQVIDEYKRICDMALRSSTRKIAQAQWNTYKAGFPKKFFEGIFDPRSLQETFIRERIAAQKAEAERLAAEKAEQERLAAEEAERERIMAQEAEEERISREQAERDRITAEKAEREHAARTRQEEEQRRQREAPGARRVLLMATGALVGFVALALGLSAWSQSGGLSVEDQAIPAAALTPMARNADWTPLERDLNGVTMVLVPAGCFDMGSDDGASDERPVHEICFDEPFWIDKYEVTNAQFADFGGQAGRSSNWKGADLPRERITWFEAVTFCELRGARLPTEAEWEYAARGPDNLVYPWGNAWNPDNANWAGTSPDQTFAVGSFSQGASWVGALDMSGNVREWMSSLDEDYPYSDNHESNSDTSSLRVLRGGSFFNSSSNLRAATRFRFSPDFVNDSFGFRCARSY